MFGINRVAGAGLERGALRARPNLPPTFNFRRAALRPRFISFKIVEKRVKVSRKWREVYKADVFSELGFARTLWVARGACKFRRLIREYSPRLYIYNSLF